jgi:arylsulfatase A-like enzyme
MGSAIPRRSQCRRARSELVALVILAWCGGTAWAVDAAEPPNVVFILADDLGWSDIAPYGSTFHDTPNLKRLADRSLRLTNCYAASPLCSPTRASILTGLYPARIGITAPVCHLPDVQLEKRLVPGSPRFRALEADSVTRMEQKYVTLAEAFRQAGYLTAHFGKWHLGYGDGYEPKDHGFDIDIPHTPRAAGPSSGYFAPWRFVSDPAFKGKPGEHIDEWMADEAAKFIAGRGDKPFFLNFWLYSVHGPWNGDPELVDEFTKRAEPQEAQRNPVYAAMVARMDRAIGRLLDALDEAKVTENTLIVFTSDNGGWAYPPKKTDPAGYEDVPATSNAPLRGGKASNYEGGTRVPCLVSWPGKVTARTSDALVCSVDWFPTLVSMAGIPLAKMPVFDGVDQAPAILDEKVVRDTIAVHFPHGNEAQEAKIPGYWPATWIRKGDWKLIRFYAKHDDGSDHLELYDLGGDIGEMHNLAASKPAVVVELAALMERFLADTAAVIPKANPRYEKRPPTGEVRLENGTASVGIDRAMGGSITWLSWNGHPKNVVNIHDPGRLIQQSYYAGRDVDRTAEGQHERWSPWSWNPIQGGGVGSWARVTRLDQKPGEIFCETVPKLWDMPNEEAAAVMRQWTAFEPGMPDVITVRCEFESRREPGDHWGDKPLPRSQELPACYFTRSFNSAKSYLGNGKWRDEHPSIGPPWSKVTPPRKVVACFDAAGQGVAIFSPAATNDWNYGPVGEGESDDPRAGPCMHVAPLATLRLGARCRVEHRYWLVVGTAASIAQRLDALIARYADEKVEVTERAAEPRGSSTSTRSAGRPNIIVILTDDHGYADLACMGQSKDAKTPHLDALAAQGVRFTSGYVTAPQCCPSRAALLTGRDQNRFGFTSNGRGPLPLGEVTIADRLGQAGYVTGMVGKWHLEPNHSDKAFLEDHDIVDRKIPPALAASYHPHARGFQETFFGYLNSYSATYDLGGNRFPKPRQVHTEGDRLDAQTAAALRFMDLNHDEPFFLYVAYYGPHVPLASSPKYLERFPGPMRERRRYALAMISAIDDGVGRIMASLAKRGIDDNTLVFFISDNGAPLKLTMPDDPVAAEGPTWNGSMNSPLAGEKGMLSEGGIRVPFVMRWKGVIPPGQVIDTPVSTLDVAPTVCAAAQTAIPATFDGVDLLPLVARGKGLPERTLTWRFWNQAAARKGDWKLLKLGNQKTYLFNVAKDKEEKNDQFAANPATAAALEKTLETWAANLTPPGLPKGGGNGQERKFYERYFQLPKP